MKDMKTIEFSTKESLKFQGRQKFAVKGIKNADAGRILVQQDLGNCYLSFYAEWPPDENLEDRPLPLPGETVWVWAEDGDPKPDALAVDSALRGCRTCF
jgi:hypothetical protein